MVDKIINMEYMRCSVCGVNTIHEIKLNRETEEVVSIECYKCKYGDSYESFEIIHDTGVKFGLGIDDKMPDIKTQQFTHEYVRAFEKMNIPQTFIGKSIEWHIITCTPIGGMVISEIKSDLMHDVEYGDVPDTLICDTETYVKNKNILKVLVKSYHEYLSLMNGITEEQLDEQFKNITEQQHQKFKEDNKKIEEITKEILQEILNKYLP